MTTAGERPKRTKKSPLLGQDIFLDKKGALVWRKKKGQAIKRATRRQGQGFSEFLAGLFVHCPERAAEASAVKAQFRHSSLDGNGIYLGKQGFHQGEIGELKLSGFLDFSPEIAVRQLCHGLWNQIGCDGDQPLCAQSQHGDGLVVIARPHIQLISARKPWFLPEERNFQRLLWCR